MTSQIANAPGSDCIKQFTIFAENKVGRLNDLVMALGAKGIHIMALCLIDTTDSTIMRFIADYPEIVRDFFEEQKYAFTMIDVVGVEIESEEEIKKVTCALVQAEINIHYLYPFLMRPSGKSGLIIRMEDQDLACEVLRATSIKVLTQADIAR